MTLHSIGFVARHYGVSVSTIRRWVENTAVQIEAVLREQKARIGS